MVNEKMIIAFLLMHVENINTTDLISHMFRIELNIKN